jgi:hypothetical protein
MAGQHDVDVAGRYAGLGQGVIEVVGAIEPVDVRALRIQLVAAPRVDEQRLVAANQQRPHAHGDAIAIVWRQALLPKLARDDPEHRAAVERKESIRQADQLEIAKPVPFDVRLAQHRRRRLLQLDQHAVRRSWVDERHHRALGPWTRVLVDQPDAAPTQILERRLDVVHPQRHVMQARPTPLQEPSDRGVRSC